MFNINIVNQNNLLPIIPLFDMSKVPSIPWSNDYNHIKDIETLEKAIKTKALDRHLETTISDEVYEEIRKIIER